MPTKASFILTDEQTTYYDDVVMGILRDEVIGRKLLPIAAGSPYGFGVQMVEFNKLVDMSAAELSYKMNENADMISYTSSKVAIPILHKEWEIDRRDLASSQRTGMPLDTIGPATAAEKVMELENKMILLGWDPAGGTTYEINGMYGAAGNSMSTSLDFGTAGNAILAAKAGVILMLADKIPPPYNLILNSAQFAEIVVPRAATSDKTELEIVKNILAGGDANGNATGLAQAKGGGNVFVNDVITAGTGLMAAAPNAKYADLAIAQDAITEYEILPKSRNVFGRVFECLIPRIKRTEAFCKWTTI